jgi:hypothetical protein
MRRLVSDKKLLSLMRKFGTPRSKIEELKDEFGYPAKKGTAYFYYSGPLDEKTRAFCKLMLSIDKVFSEDDISVMSIELGYDVEKYRGSYNCRHKWIRFRGKEILTPKPTITQIRRLIDKGISS